VSNIQEPTEIWGMYLPVLQRLQSRRRRRNKKRGGGRWEGREKQ
jgi:hypothetical protein